MRSPKATLREEAAGSRAPAKPEPELTVAICTRDRRESLLRAIASLAEPVAPDARAGRAGWTGWELLVVDNASRDDTRSACESLVDTLPVPMRVVVEPTPGLSHARNRALSAARTRVVVFVDDDVRCHPGFAAAHARAFASPDVVATGGRILPVLPATRRGWWARRLARELGGPTGRYDFGDEAQEIPGASRILLPFGGNFGVLRSEALALGGFRSELGFGTDLVPGEETALLTRLARRGGRMRYVPEATVDHFLDARRASFGYFRRWHRGYGRALVRMDPAASAARVMRTTAAALLRAARRADVVRLVKSAECGVGQLLELRARSL